MVMKSMLSAIPQIEKILSAKALEESVRQIGRPIVASLCAAFIQGVREDALAGGGIPGFDDCVLEVKQQCTAFARKRIIRVINATGIILHTNLGRSPLPVGVWDAAKQNVESYAAIEMNLGDGKRGKRFPFAVEAMKVLVHAESAIMLNNNAASVFLLLKAIAGSGHECNEVIVARGQQVQIGGGFRIPDILHAAGCRLVEVGTTNITTIRDIQAALTEKTAMVLWVHTSNYKIRGFTHMPSVSDIKKILPSKVILAADQGSGAIHADIAEEPPVSSFLRDGADVVCFSGDKIFGGPQCGWIVGKQAIIDIVARHPLMRTYRVGRIVAALMEETLLYYLNGGRSAAEKAVLCSQDTLKIRSERLVAALPPQAARIISYPFSTGGGSTPDAAFPSWALEIFTKEKVETAKTALRLCPVPIIAFIDNNRLLIHLAAVDPANDEYISEQLQGICKKFKPDF